MLTWGWLAAVVLAAVLLWTLADQWWVATVFLYGPRWLLLVPMPVLVIAALLVRPMLLGPLLAALLITVGPVLGWRTGWRGGTGPADGEAVRIITFNMRSTENLMWRDVPTELADLAPDAALVQECPAGFTDPRYLPAGWHARWDAGLCLLTRLPVDSVRVSDVIETRRDGVTGHAVIYFLGGAWRGPSLVNVHLETPRRGLERVRERADASLMYRNLLLRNAGADRIARWVAREASGAVVSGDFNLPVESRIYRRHWGDCVNAFSRVGRGFGYTRVLRRWSVRIDHVLLCGDRQRVRSATVGPDLGSDHLPLIVELLVEGDG